MIPHGGMNGSNGQHACFAMPNILWGECFVSPPPGVPLIEIAQKTPGMSVPEEGYLIPIDGPGFGIYLTLDDIESFAQLIYPNLAHIPGVFGFHEEKLKNTLGARLAQGRKYADHR